MGDSAVACTRGRGRPSWSRTQGEAHAGGMGEPEDADPAQVSRVIRVRGVAESPIYLALRELRALTGLLETRLLALLHARVTGEEAVALELAAQVRVGFDERPGDAVTQRHRLRRDAAAVDLRHDVH